jgi:hypothetical protein
MSNNEILHTANGTAIEKIMRSTKMYSIGFNNNKEGEPVEAHNIVTEFFIIVGDYGYAGGHEEYIKAYCEIHKHENKEITSYAILEATHHDPDLNLLDLAYGHSDQGLAVYDHSNCSIESLNYGWDLEDVLDTIQAQQEQKPTLTVV